MSERDEPDGVLDLDPFEALRGQLALDADDEPIAEDALEAIVAARRQRHHVPGQE